MNSLIRKSKLADVTKEILLLKENIIRDFYEIGLRLKEVRDSKLYRQVYKNFEEYCKAELNFKKSMAYNLISIVEAFPDIQLVGQIPMSTLLEIKRLPSEKRKEIIEVVKSEGLSKRETKELVDAELGQSSRKKPIKAETIKDPQQFKEILEEHLTEITCFNPPCSNHIKTTIEQKRDLLISFVLKYDAIVLPVCSKECEDALLSTLRE